MHQFKSLKDCKLPKSQCKSIDGFSHKEQWSISCFVFIQKEINEGKNKELDSYVSSHLL